MKITFLGAAQTVTGSKYLLEDNDGNRILIDCGLFQGLKELRLKNWDTLPTQVDLIKAVLLTHAHIDHSGYLPLLAKNGFNGPIYASAATKALCSILLPDSGHIHEEDAKRANRYGYTKHHPALPLYTEDDAKHVLKQIHAVKWGKPYAITPNINASWHHAGHILGASFVVCQSEGTRILFSGDLGRFHDPVMDAPAGIQQAEYIVVESTYGDRKHSEQDPLEFLKEVIVATYKRGGSIIIPSFAVGRAQMLLYYLYQLKQSQSIPDLPVYLDSPMAINATDLLLKFHKDHKLSAELSAKVCDSAIYVRTQEESKKIDNSVIPKIIISASGMATGGRILHHLKVYAPDHRNAIIMTGYQAQGTRGASIAEGETEVKIHGSMIPIRASVHNLPNVSAHADYEETLHWLSGLSKAPRCVFITHGDLRAAESLKEKIEARFGWTCKIPGYLDEEEL